MEPLQDADPRHVGQYEILGRLGEGGSGVVYEARSPEGDRVAVKVLHPELAESEDLRRRLAREAEALQRVRGDRIARVLSVDVDGATPHIVMELAEGETLAAIVEREPLKGPMLTGLAEGLLEALADIHGAGIIHRDLKPSNIIFGPRGVKVVDFGVSAFEELAASTRTGVLMGTPAWLAPEQATGQPVGPAADLHNVGMVLAFAATGNHPYGQGRPDAMLFRIVHQEPSLDGVPTALLRVVESCLRKDPSERPALHQLVEAVTGHASGSGGTAGATRHDPSTRLGTGVITALGPADRRRRRRRRILGAAAAVTVLGVIGAGWFVLEEADAQGPLEIVYRDVTEDNPQLDEMVLEVSSGGSTPLVLRVAPDAAQDEIRQDSRWALSEQFTVRYRPSSGQSDAYLETFDLRTFGMDALSRGRTVRIELVIDDDGASLEVTPARGLRALIVPREEAFLARADEEEVQRLAREAERERQAEEARQQAERERELRVERERQEREIEAARQERIAEARALRASCTSSTRSLWDVQMSMVYFMESSYDSARSGLITGGAMSPYQYQLAIWTLDGIMVDNYNTANASLSGAPGGANINPATSRVFRASSSLIDAWRSLSRALSTPRPSGGERYSDVYPSEHRAIDSAQNEFFSAMSNLRDAVRRDAASDCARQYPDP